MHRAALLWLATLLSAFAVTAFAYVSPGAPTGYVNDFSGTLSSNERGALETTLQDFHEKNGGEIAVAVVSSLSGESIEGYANTLFREWGIGSEERNDGVLLLVAMEERTVRIEVGYGYEGTLTDARSSQIVRDAIVPRLREGAYGRGISDGVSAIIATLAGEVAPIPAEQSFDPALLSREWVFGIVFFLIALSAIFRTSRLVRAVVGFFIGSMLATAFGLAFFWAGAAVGVLFGILTSMKFVPGGTGGSSWGGGFRGGSSGGGGFGGFGGGSSGGGGATGRW